MDQKIFTAFQPKIRILLGISFLLSLSIGGCSQIVSSGDPLLESLSGKGPVQLTPENPYLAPVQFLSREMQKSKDLAGFIDLKGYPKSIEVNSGSFGAISMKFSYNSGERYELELSKSDDISSSWIINGPFQGFPSPNKTAPQEKVKIKLTPSPIAEKIPVIKTTASPIASIAPTLRPTPIATEMTAPPTPIAISSPVVEPALAPSEDFASPSKVSLPDEQAEITPRGDLVHYVTMPGETLSILSRWYTKDRENAGKLSRLNKLKNPNVLTIGDTIVIPSYMVKNKTRLSESSLQELIAATTEATKKR